MALEVAGLTGMLTLLGLIVGLIKVKQLGVAQAVIALGVILGAQAIITTVTAIPVVGEVIAAIFAIVQGFAVGALVRAGLSMFGKSTGVKALKRI